MGKAARLRDRLANYFSAQAPDKTRYFLARAARLETLICASEYEALMLEYTLIKEHRPPFNIVFRDDKRYPYIKITAGDFPRIVLTRRIEDDTARGARYFGPYVSGFNVRRILDMVHRFFKIRTCKRKLVEGRKSPPLCLQYFIKRCDGPCECLVSKAEYAVQAAQAERFLRGDYEALLRDQQSRMRAASASKSYELAALCRDRIAALRELSEKQRAATARARDMDAVSFVSDPNRARICFCVFKVRKGHITGSSGFVFPAGGGSEPEALGQFLMEYYKLPGGVPREIAIKAEPPDMSSLKRWLAERSGHPVRLWSPGRGYAHDLLDLAEKNARARLYERADPQAEEVLDRVREKLQLARRPECIHGYDVANLGPAIVTGARVVFRRGKPDKSLYRSFGLQTLEIKDDYAAMEELVRRSIRRALEEESPAAPDLILVDGGLGHVRAARKALALPCAPASPPSSPLRNSGSTIQNLKSKIQNLRFEIVGLAKEEELIVLEDGGVVRLRKTDPALQLLQRIRDEAHRFSRRLLSTRACRKMLARAEPGRPAPGPAPREIR
ncbi:MAG: excinuclease ABC subunit C [Candidatus Lindowbacteria bacterium RIFCSPLOWO2_12_FULL_62_27]|nr:MAG: excinuclease ABC subunit C [Candidatus Lindowbacteria bacterium RIFCSPLOWO2_12_FULL_62_27]OGH56755.1 MAG: excinuclease ABC subunit C [Candidatus Lindowbacteria bacterium RIFCSPLOWO2_02_FULL_62_12]